MKRVNFAPDKQKTWLKKVKQSSRMTWNNLASFIGVSRATIFNYLAEKYLIPLPTVKKLEKLGVEVRKEWVIELREDGCYRDILYKKNNVKIPGLADTELAEFLGALLGDGHIGSTTYEISISCNLQLDSVYVKQFLTPLITTLFNKVPSIYESRIDNTIRCKFYSKKVHTFLTQEIGLPEGKKVKSDRLRIPQNYLKLDKCLIACLRGLFDTDGGIYRHREREPMIEFDSHNKFLSVDMVRALRKLGFRASISKGKVYIYAKNDINKFFEMIGSRNPRNLFKFLIWKKDGIVPRTSDMRPWSSLV